MSNAKQVAIASFLAPLMVVPAILILVVTGGGGLSEALPFMIVGTMIAYASMVVVGLPAYLYFSRQEGRSLGGYALVGAIVPIVVILSFPVFHGDFHDILSTSTLYFLAFFAGCGLAVSLTFKLILDYLVNTSEKRRCFNGLPDG